MKLPAPATAAIAAAIAVSPLNPGMLNAMTPPPVVMSAPMQQSSFMLADKRFSAEDATAARQARDAKIARTWWNKKVLLAHDYYIVITA